MPAHHLLIPLGLVPLTVLIFVLAGGLGLCREIGLLDRFRLSGWRKRIFNGFIVVVYTLIALVTISTL